MMRGLRLSLSLCLVALTWFASASLAADFRVANLEVRHVRVNGVDLGYRTIGQGEPLLLVMGYACTMDVWDPTLVQSLAASRQLILFDNRGMGASTANDETFSIKLFASDAAGLLDALGVAQADALGWSMGAMTALHLALSQPGKVRKLALYGAAVDQGPVRAAVERMAAMPPDVFLANLFPKPWLSARPDVFERLPRSASPVDPAIVARQRRALADWPGFGDELSQSAKPGLVVAGEEDWVTPVDQSLKLVQAVKGSWLARFQGAGHWLMYQAPEDLARVVEAFLQTRERLAPDLGANAVVSN